MASVDPALLALAAARPPDGWVPVRLRFEAGDGVRRALPALRALGFVGSAAPPTEVAGEVPAGSVPGLAAVPGLVAALPSARRRPQ